VREAERVFTIEEEPNVVINAGTGVLRPQAKESQQPQAGRGKQWIFPRPSRSILFFSCLDFSFVRFILNFRLKDCQRINLSCFKPTCLC
jgi:hypothetical protein